MIDQKYKAGVKLVRGGTSYRQAEIKLGIKQGYLNRYCNIIGIKSKDKRGRKKK